MGKEELLYCIKPEQQKPEMLQCLLEEHPEIRFVSLMGVDFGGNDTDEKIPVQLFTDDVAEFLTGSAVQTDGSSVVLPGIATLNDAKVDLKVDTSVNWYVDYNYEHIDGETGKLVGTLRMPCFLVHHGRHVCSRSILADTLAYLRKEMLALLDRHPSIHGLEKLAGHKIRDIVFTCATELEFWVKTPNSREDADDLTAAQLEALSSSQIMQEMYWQRTRGNVRTALEECLQTMSKYGMEPEMGHKENGGVKGKLDTSGHMTHIMEQLEIDWKYSLGVQTADNELLARNIVKETFRKYGLEVSFEAKPIPGVAGSGEHHHVGMGAILENGKFVNLFAPADMQKEFLSAVGYGALMGILKNYEVVNPFISCTTDAFNRLQPGFEAPVCVVTSLGMAPDQPSRNRSILLGLIRNMESPNATRFEIRSPNDYTNSYIAFAIFYLAAWDGIKACVERGKSLAELEKEMSKKYGEEGFYLEQNREYRSEKDVFEDFTAEEREKLFGRHPATVWENIKALDLFPEKKKVLLTGNILKEEYISSFCEGALNRWKTELVMQYVPEYVNTIKNMPELKNSNDWDEKQWEKIASLRCKLAKNGAGRECLFSQIRRAAAEQDYDKLSALQLEVQKDMKLLAALYHDYQQNIID